jgi:hypothetical protein
MVNEEPVLPRDKEMMDLLLTLGIERGKEFKPNLITQASLKAAAQETQAWFMQALLTYGVQFWPDRKWLVPVVPIAPTDRIQMGECELLRRGRARNRLLRFQHAASEITSSDLLPSSILGRAGWATAG